MAPKRASSSRAGSSRAGSSSEIPPAAAPQYEWPAWNIPIPQPMQYDAPTEGAGEEAHVPTESEEETSSPQRQQQQDPTTARRQKRMAKKKAVPDEFDTTRFISALAQFNYNRMNVGNCHPEQGLDLKSRGNPKDLKFFLDHLRDTVAFHHWEQFTQPQGKYSPHVALEFLVNIDRPERERPSESVNKFRSRCRSVWVDFSPKTINAFYNLPDYDGRDEYSRLLGLDEDILNWRSIEWVLTRGTGPLEKEKTSHLSFKTAKLDVEAKVWMKVIANRLMPTKHTTGIGKAMLLLIYCVATNQTVDVGRIIARQIKYFQPGKNASIIFPSLITQLCLQKKKFQKIPDTELLTCPPDISLKQIQQIKGTHYYNSLESFMNSVPAGSAVPEEPQVQEDPVESRQARIQSMPQRTFLCRLEQANQRAHLCTRRYHMEVAQAMQTGAPIPPYPQDNFFEQEQFYLEGEEPENDPETAADEDEDA